MIYLMDKKSNVHPFDLVFPCFLMAVLSMWDVFGRNHPDGQPARWTSIPQDAVNGRFLDGVFRDILGIPVGKHTKKAMENHFFKNLMGFYMVLYGLICLNMFDMFNRQINKLNGPWLPVRYVNVYQRT